jgi:glutamine amidotransferase
MCRLFGFRSVIPSQVHQSLVGAENALMLQSDRHPDGWGVAYYVANYPHLIKSASQAMDDHLFKHVSGIVSSETVIAHVRAATHGVLSLVNSHPFQFGRWIFAHNGNIPDFENVRENLIALIPPVKRRFILGNTDSEVFFYLLLDNMERRYDLHRSGYPLEEIESAIRQTIDQIQAASGLCCFDDNELYLTFVITNGETMAAHQGGKELLFSTHKTCCPERDSCPSFSNSCETPLESGFVNHLIFSSEALHGTNVWGAMRDGEIVGVDWRMRLQKSVMAGPDIQYAPQSPL